MRVWSLFFCPWLRLCLNIQTTCLTLFYNTNWQILANILTLQNLQTKNIRTFWWAWFSDWPHRLHLPHCGNRHRTLCHCMPPVFQGLTFWLLVSFVLIIVSLPVFVRICLYLSATPFSMYDLAVGDFFYCWLLYKVGRRSLAKIFTTMAKKCWRFLCIVKFQRFLSLRSSISVRVCFLKIKASVRIELQLWAINYIIYFINGEKMSSSVGMPDQTMDSLPNLIKN